jgi:hypothetical protein
MGQTTPNIGIYIPAAGETNYDASFSAGMVNIDQHDHSGGPNKGVPISSSGLDDGSVTYPKLDANVADNSTGIGTHTGGLANQLYLLGVLPNIYALGQLPSAGIISINGTTAAARTIAGTANQVTVTNGDGVSGNPTISFPSTFYSTGTFVPTVFGASVAGTTTYLQQIGFYTKIGNLVFAYGTVQISAATGTGTCLIGGLPFVVANGQVPGAVSSAPGAGWSWASGGTMLVLQSVIGQTYAQIESINGGSGTATAVQQPIQNNPVIFVFSLTYQTT